MGLKATWNADLEFGVTVVDDDVVTAGEHDAVIVDEGHIVLHVGLDPKGVPAQEAQKSSLLLW